MGFAYDVCAHFNLYDEDFAACRFKHEVAFPVSIKFVDFADT